MFKRKKSENKEEKVSEQNNLSGLNIIQINDENYLDLINIDNIDETKLFEIKDKNIVGSLNSVFPTILQSASSKNPIKLKNLDKVYKATFPSGATLARSRDSLEGFRGFYHDKGKIAGHADFDKIQANDLIKGPSSLNIVSNVMNVSSLIVGQYYMNQVNNKLSNINSSLNEITDFQEREFKANIISLVNNVIIISKYNSEIIENNDLRIRKLNQLDKYEDEASRLILQTNETIKDIIKNDNIKLSEYKTLVNKLDKYLSFQQILNSVLAEISELIYLFNFSLISIELAFEKYNKYLEIVNDTNLLLNNWHNKIIDNLGIELDNNRIKKQDIEGLFFKIPAKLIDDKFNFKKLESNFKTKIINQINVKNEKSEVLDVYDKDVEIVIKNDKYYYLVNDKM